MNVAALQGLLCSNLVLAGCITNTSEQNDAEVFSAAEQSISEDMRFCHFSTAPDNRQGATLSGIQPSAPFHLTLKHAPGTERVSGVRTVPSQIKVITLSAVVLIGHFDNGDDLVVGEIPTERTGSAPAQISKFSNALLTEITFPQFIQLMVQGRISAEFQFADGTSVRKRIIPTNDCPVEVIPS